MTDQDGHPLFPETIAWEDAQAALEALELGDGLPLVPPTLSRFDAMVSGRGPIGRSFGHVLPLMGELTLEAAAYNCILAGCRPEELPVVLTAVEATIEEPFNLLGVLSTTGTATVAVCVHGPVVDALGLNAGGNILGPGNRANACIGRAVNLIMRNVGGARAGVCDMATMGQPGKYTFCFAEGSHDALPPLPLRRGFNATDSCVTVCGVSGTSEVLPAGPGGRPELVLQPIAAAMNAAIDSTSGMRTRERGEQVFLIPPELADVLRGAGWDLARVQDYLFEARHPYPFDGQEAPDDRPITLSPDDIHPIITGGAGVKMTYLPIWSGGSRTVTKRVRTFDT
jgi:hypothetical protein